MELSKAKVEGLFADLAEMKRRIEQLERANPLVGALPRGTSIVVLDSSGNLVAEIGKVGGTEDGVALYANGSAVLKATKDDGMLAPNIPVVAIPASYTESTPTTVGWSLEYSGSVHDLQHKYVKVQISANTGAGAAASLRVSTSSGQISTALVLPVSAGLGASLYMELTAAIGTPQLVFYVEVNNPGPNPVTLRMPEITVGDFTAFATTAGVWI